MAHSCLQIPKKLKLNPLLLATQATPIPAMPSSHLVWTDTLILILCPGLCPPLLLSLAGILHPLSSGLPGFSSYLKRPSGNSIVVEVSSKPAAGTLLAKSTPLRDADPKGQIKKVLVGY